MVFGITAGPFRDAAGRMVARCRSGWWVARLKLDALASGGRVELANTVRLRTRTLFRGCGTLRIGEHVVLGDANAGRPYAPILLAPRNAGSWIGIGAKSTLANGVEMIAMERIEIGERFMAGAGTRILDSDFHGVPREERSGPGRSAPVRIGDDVWLGMSAMVLKGVSIGDGSVIGAGSVVMMKVPDGAVVLGNPARSLPMYAKA